MPHARLTSVFAAACGGLFDSFSCVAGVKFACVAAAGGPQQVLRDIKPDAGLTGRHATVTWGLFRLGLCPWVSSLLFAAAVAAAGAARRAAGCYA
jgi:hypothetical protein